MTRKITHIGVVVHDLGAAIQQWSENFGFKEIHRADIEVEGLRTAMLSPNGLPGEMAVELIEPIDKGDLKNAVARHLAKNGEGFYHLAIATDDIAGSGDALEHKAIKVIKLPPAPIGAALQGIVAEGTGRRVVHPKAASGILIELLQSCA